MFENQIGRAARSCPEEISPYDLPASAGRVFTWRFIAAFEQRACGSMGNYFPADRNETGDLRIEVSVAQRENTMHRIISLVGLVVIVLAIVNFVL